MAKLAAATPYRTLPTDSKNFLPGTLTNALVSSICRLLIHVGKEYGEKGNGGRTPIRREKDRER